jgi:SAM-dependent methyltransferase
VGTAAERWRDALERWAIPPSILEAAPESPWGFPVELFASRVDAAVERPTPSNLRAMEALPEGGSVLDVGCGAGAASIPLAERAALLTGVDTSEGMLEEFARRASGAGVRYEAVSGRWPDVASRLEPADVVVCNHVFYNAPDLGPFVVALTAHARERVVVEVTPDHPTSNLNPLWMRFHGLSRPTEPTVGDAMAVVEEAAGIRPSHQIWSAPPSGGFARTEDLVAWIRRRLCLPASRDPEVADALASDIVEEGGLAGFGPRDVVTLWWPGSARKA